MKIIKSIFELKKAIKNYNNIGFVPTMGGIHKGHASLIKASQSREKKTIVSIFVNPTQFNKKKDFNNYPRNLKKDLEILKRLKVDYLFLPQEKEIYMKKMRKFILKKSEMILCAKFRKGHFEGVLDVMDKLTDIVRPTKIFMGNKDFQQLFLIKKHLKKKYNTEVVGCKTIREKNKVALSSRNYLLSKGNLILASKIVKKLINIKKNIKNKKNKNKYLLTVKDNFQKQFKIKIEYLELRNINNLKLSNTINTSRLFVAYYLNGVRLIDNL